MATFPRHKKAKLIRDFMIQTDTVKMFKEDENNDTIFFRSVYLTAKGFIIYLVANDIHITFVLFWGEEKV